MRSYFARNDWAGRLRVKDTVILDSPLNNACAHFMNLALFAAGPRLAESANPERVEAELYRANAIESADTFSVRVTTREEVDIVCNLAHPCQTGRGPVFRLECDGGVITHDRTTGNPVDWRVQVTGTAERPLSADAVPADPFRATAEWLLGKRETPVYTLAMARPHTLVVNGAHLAGPIHTIPAEFCLDTPTEANDDSLRHVRDMNTILDRCFADGALISETGLAPWAQKPGIADVSALRTFSLP